MGETASKPAEYHGLTELAARRGWRRLSDTERDGAWLSERTVFRDSVTGCIAWRITCDPAVDVNDYYDIPGWNADGSVLGFLTRRRGGGLESQSGRASERMGNESVPTAANTSGRERWLMDANGDNLRPMPSPDGEPLLDGYWSMRYPDRFYRGVSDDRGTHVVAVNPFTGEQRVVVSVPGNLGPMMPPHPSEEWFLFGTKIPGNGLEGTKSQAYVVGLDGSVQTVEFERRWHRLRFTKGSDRRLFFNYDEPRTQWTILPDGTDRHAIPQSGGHPDWLLDGSELTYYAEGSVWGIRHDGTHRRRVIELQSGGHGGPCLDREWFISDTPPRGKYPASIISFRIDGSEVCHRLFVHQSSMYSHTARGWHPDHHATHPHPNTSPDGTKAIFNSDFMGQYSDLYIAVVRYPDPPRNLSARREGDSVVLTWDAPRRSRETRGYCVYHSDQSGMGYQRLTDEPVAGHEWRTMATAVPAFYVVTAIERSGLESRPSHEVFGLGNERWQGAARLCIEAEDGDCLLPMQTFVDHQAASNGTYVGSRDGLAGGRLTLRVTMPKPGQFALWARAKGEGSFAASAGASTGTLPCSGQAWGWHKASCLVELAAGEQELALVPTTGRECVDKLLLTDDLAFVPSGLMALDSAAPETPAELAARSLSANTIRLSWKDVGAADLDHYNVYCGRTKGFACAQGSLVGSPSAPEFVDWGLEPGTVYWYRVTAVDRAGNESPSSTVIDAKTPPFQPVRIELDPAKAALDHMQKLTGEAESVILRPGAGSGWSATWKFSLPRDGAYAIWGRSMHQRPADEHDGQDPTQFLISHFDLVLDGKRVIPWEAWGFWGEWHWSPAGAKITGSPQVFELGAGEHTLQVRPRTPKSVLAGIVISDDPTYWPVEGMKQPATR